MWEKVRLKEICTLFDDGDWIETKHQSETGIRLIQTGNVKTGSFSDRIDKARYISEETFASLKCTEIFCEDILVSRLPQPVGRACIIPPLDERAITAVDCTIIRVQKEKVIPEFLNYFMQSPSYFSSVQSEVTGATRQRISRKKLGEIPISLPPLAEQQRIVAKLDAAFAEIDAAIEVTKSKSLNADDLLSVFLEQTYRGSFKNYEQSSLGDVCQFFNGKAHEKDIDENGNYVVVNSKFISSDGYVKKYSNTQMFPLVKGDVVMVMSDVPNGMALAKTFLIDENEKYSLNQRICCIRTKLYQPKFLQSLINRHSHFLQFNNGENQTNLRKNDILGCPLPVVPLDKQEHAMVIFKKFTSSLRDVNDAYVRKLQNLRALKSAILAQELQSEAA